MLFTCTMHKHFQVSSCFIHIYIFLPEVKNTPLFDVSNFENLCNILYIIVRAEIIERGKYCRTQECSIARKLN